RRQEVAGPFELGDALLLIGPRIDAPLDPVHETILPRIAVHDVHRSQNLPFFGEVDLNRIVHPAAADALEAAAVGAGPEDPAGKPLVDLAVGQLHLVPMPAVA